MDVWSALSTLSGREEERGTQHEFSFSSRLHDLLCFFLLLLSSRSKTTLIHASRSIALLLLVLFCFLFSLASRVCFSVLSASTAFVSPRPRFSMSSLLSAGFPFSFQPARQKEATGQRDRQILLLLHVGRLLLPSPRPSDVNEKTKSSSLASARFFFSRVEEVAGALVVVPWSDRFLTFPQAL